MKKVSTFLGAMMLLMVYFTLGAWGNSQITAKHNSQPLRLQSSLILENSSVWIEAEEGIRLLGLSTQWNDDHTVLSGTYGDYILTLSATEPQVKVNGTPLVSKLDLKVVEQKLYAPLQLLNETLGAEITWNESRTAVNISTSALDREVTVLEPHVKAALLAKANKSTGQSLTKRDLLCMVNLDVSSKNITAIRDLAQLKNLQTLDLSNNQVDSIAPLAGMRYLKVLNIAHNRVNSLEPLNSCFALEELYAKDNTISDVQVAAYWPHIKVLELANNNVDTDEEKAPLYYLRETLRTDLDLSTAEEPLYNTYNLRYTAPPFKHLVADTVYWVPASYFGAGRNKNEAMADLVSNTPDGKSVQVRTVYDAVQMLEHSVFTLQPWDTLTTTADGKIQWHYSKNADKAWRTMSGSEKALSNGVAYLLMNDYSESGVMTMVLNNGTEKSLCYLKYDYDLTTKNAKGEKVTQRITEYGVFDPVTYVKNSTHPAAVEGGFLAAYEQSGGITSNIHVSSDLLSFAKAYVDADKLAGVYAYAYGGSKNQYFPAGISTADAKVNGRIIYIPLGKDEVEYPSKVDGNLIYSICNILYDAPGDSISIKKVLNTTKSPALQ